MPDKQELLSKFAAQTGAEVPGVQDAHQNAHTSDNVEPSQPADSPAPQSQNEELFKDSFSDRTQLKAWQNPKYKGILVLCIVLPFSLLIAWVFKDGIPKPSLAKTPTPPALPPNNDDTAKPATDGEWAALTSTNGMRQDFNGAADKEHADGTKKFQDQIKANQAQKAAGNATPPGEVSPSEKAAIEDSGTPMDDSGAPMDEAPAYRPVRSYTPPEPVRYSPPRTQVYGTRLPKSVTRAGSVTPKQTVSKSKLASAQASKSQRPTVSKQEERSPQERIAAMLAATSTSGSGSTTIASGANHDDTGFTNGSGSTPSIYGSPVAAVPSMPTQSKTQFTSSVSPVASATRGGATNASLTGQSGALQPAYPTEPMGYLPSEAAVIQGQAQTLINRSQSAKGKLLTSIAFMSGDYGSLAGQPVEVELTETLGDLPVGTRIVAVVEATQNNRSGHDNKAEVVRLQPTAIMVGDVEMPLPEGAIGLSGKDGAPLLAKRGGSDFLRFLGGLGGMVTGGAGMTNFGASQNVEFGDASYFQSVGTNVATGVLSNGAQQLQQSGAGGNVLILKAGSSVTVSVLKPLTLPLTTHAWLLLSRSGA